MHRRPVHTLLINTPQAEAVKAAALWSAALGVPAFPDSEPEFVNLHIAPPGLVTAVQSVDAPRWPSSGQIYAKGEP